MTMNLSSEYQELEECLINLKELQQSLENEVKKKNTNLLSWRTNEAKVETEIQNKEIELENEETKKENQLKNKKIPIIENNTGIKNELNTTVQSNKQICTDLDQLIRRMKKEETSLNDNKYVNKSQEKIVQSKTCQTDNIYISSISSQSDIVTRQKSRKLDEHNQNLLNRFNSMNRTLYYSSLPKIVPANDGDCFSIIYKSSSQTNLSQPTSDYKIAFTIYQPNRTMKTILIDEFTTAGEICQLLTARNYLMPSITFALVEKTTRLKIERIFEDDETPVLFSLSYPEGSNKSMIFFEDREDKYGLFTEPGKWLGSSFSNKDHEKCYISEIFNGPVPQLPCYRSHLFYRKIARTNWRRDLCLLRNSGLYAIKKSNKHKSTDLKLIISLHPSLHLYTTIGGWSHCKTPTPYGFCLKTYGEQNPKYIAYFCAPSETSLRYWSSMFRIALKGRTLLANYQNQLQFVSNTLNTFQESNEMNLLRPLSRSLGCVTGRSDIHTDF